MCSVFYCVIYYFLFIRLGLWTFYANICADSRLVLCFICFILLYIRKKNVGFTWFLICVNGIYLVAIILIQYRGLNIQGIDAVSLLSYLLDLPILCVGKIVEKIVNNDCYIIISIIIEGLLVFGMSN